MDIIFAGAVILFLAFVPMALYALLLWWFDRYEKEPFGLVLAAFLWGAVPAIVFALVAQLVFEVPIASLMDPLSAELATASLLAPLTEEPFKGLMLVLLFIFFRRELDSPVDGILYGALVGFGFAATENVLYFFGEYESSGLSGVVGLTFFRAILFGLNHALFTGCTGLGVALARISPNWLVKITAPLAGLAAGVTLHAIHNAGATLGGTLCWPIMISLVSDWGGVLVLVGILVWASLREQSWLVRQLEEEVSVGAISLRDYHVIQSYWRRLGQRAQALVRGDIVRWRQLGRYYHLATELAFVKQRWIRFGREPETGLRVEQLRRDLYEMRKQM